MADVRRPAVHAGTWILTAGLAAFGVALVFPLNSVRLPVYAAVESWLPLRAWGAAILILAGGIPLTLSARRLWAVGLAAATAAALEMTFFMLALLIQAVSIGQGGITASLCIPPATLCIAAMILTLREHQVTVTRRSVTSGR